MTDLAALMVRDCKYDVSMGKIFITNVLTISQILSKSLNF